MKKMTSLVLSLLYLCTVVYAQQVIENPKKQLGNNKGRTVLLEEKMRIKDQSEGFYFKNPFNLKVAADGSIFVLDSDQFLKFAGNGKFLKNLFKKGHGPGEFVKIENYLFCHNKIIAHQTQPNKIVEMDMEGNLIKEIKPQVMVSKLITCFKDKYIMLRHSFPEIKQKELGVVDVTWDILIVSGDSKVEATGLRFPVKWFGKRIGNAFIANYITDFFYTIYKERYLVIFHTQNYRLKVLDLEKNQVVRTFKRDYESVKYVPDKKEKLKAPRDYYNDIQKLLVYNDEIWVFTSLIDKKKGVLIDVFNIEGRYLNFFYLPLPGHLELRDISDYPMTIAGDFIFTVRLDENSTPFIAKNKIVNRD